MIDQPMTAAETTPENPWPVRRLSENLKHYLSKVSPTWVEGQLIEYKVVRGNAWMTLRDLDEDYSLPVAAWRNIAGKMDPSIDKGSRVVAWIKPDFYPKSGRLTMIAQDIRPVGIGELLARIELLRRTLAEEGLFSPELKKPLPVLPQLIGLITGKDSDAMKDVMTNARLRWPAAQFKVVPTAVQGPQAPGEVTAALQTLDADPEVDVIVIARGGGALEEVVLPFSDEQLIRAVAATQTPVVSAIGHENDNPILDNVADIRASTPTDAAKLIVPDAAIETAAISETRLRLAGAVERMIDQHSEQLDQLRSRPVLASPHTIVDDRAEELHQIVQRARMAFASHVRHGAENITGLRARLRALSPQHTLNRGYAVVQHQQRPVTEAATLKTGDDLDILVASGRFGATVTTLHQPTPERPQTQENS